MSRIQGQRGGSLNTSDVDNEEYVNQLARSPDWCPCDIRTFSSLLSHLQRGNRLMLQAIVQHIYPDILVTNVTNGNDVHATKSCCVRHLSQWNLISLPEYPVELAFFRICFEQSHVSMMPQWIRYDQQRRVLPPIHSETYAILFHHWIREKPVHSSSAIWLLHILSRLRVEHLHPPLVPFEAMDHLRYDPVLQSTLKECRHLLENDRFEVHPSLVPTLQSYLDQWIAS